MFHRDRPKRLRFAAIAAAFAVLVGGGSYLLLYEAPPPLQGVPLGSLKQPSPMIDPSTPSVAAAREMPPPTRPAAGVTLRQHVAKLAKGTPRDAWDAYRLATNCELARRGESQGRPAKANEHCQDIDPGQITSRLQWLDRAVNDGVPGAIAAKMVEGPDGSSDFLMHLSSAEYQQRPEVVAFLESLGTGLEKAAANGDFRAAERLATLRYERQDRAEALTYFVASERMAVARGAKEPMPKPTYEASVQAFGSGLTPEQRAAALNKGEQIALSAQRSTYWRMQ